MRIIILFLQSMLKTGGKYISVLLPLKLDWTPYYEAGDGEIVRKGDWVRVNFAGREYVGTVAQTGVVPENTDKIKRITAVEKSLDPVTDEEMRLWTMVADYYLCSAGEVLRAAYPAVRISSARTLAKIRERERLRREKAEESLKLRLGRIEDRIRSKELKISTAGNPASKGVLKLKEDIARLTAQARALTDEWNALRAGGITPEDLRKETAEGNWSGKARPVNTMERCRQGAEPKALPVKNAGKIVLTETQLEIYRKIEDGIPGVRRNAAEIPKPVLLKGVTGSGKTEIYLKAALRTLEQGRNVLYLVPEIAMGRQLTERVREVFGDLLLTFHSEESEAGKRDCADRIRRSGTDGTPYIVLGTRSALFLPHRNLGLIIVDEEHDSSYKQDSPAPRYNGRDVAVMLSTIHGCGIILGSATPSLESVFNCRCGKYLMLSLTERYYSAEEAEVEIIDTSAERRKKGMAGSFSKKLVEKIGKTLEKGEQVLILRGRRAFSPVMQCPECGEIPKCPRCNVSLSFHKNPDRMLCHHCGYSAAFVPYCPKCGSVLQGLGSGTQKIEEEARALFPAAGIARLDSDTPKTVASETIARFNAGETDILIGTQIISKGFDFPGLTLTAIIAADSLLGVQDFRADEKALQALEQLRGRCGRRDRKGTFIIQTYKPEHPVYRHLADGNIAQLYTDLMQERKEFACPPFTRLINISVKDVSEEKAETAARRLAAELKTQLVPEEGRMQNDAEETVSEPFRPPVDRIAGFHIRMIRIVLLKDRHLRDLKKKAAAAVAGFEKRNRYQGHVTIDVDPE